MPKQRTIQTPVALDPTIVMRFDNSTKRWYVGTGYMSLARFDSVERKGVIFCFCELCQEKRGDPYHHDFHSRTPESWANRVVKLYPSMFFALRAWLKRYAPNAVLKSPAKTPIRVESFEVLPNDLLRVYMRNLNSDALTTALYQARKEP
jgi:hypothetical protein